MELMWGLKNLVKSLVREEKLELTKEDCLPMSKGMTIFLERNGFAVKPQMVSTHPHPFQMLDLHYCSLLPTISVLIVCAL
jgi:hypothetical protein